jgi:hypothetical protein
MGRLRHRWHAFSVGKQGRNVEFWWDNFLKIKHLEEQDDWRKACKSTLAGDRLAILNVFVLFYLKLH